MSSPHHAAKAIPQTALQLRRAAVDPSENDSVLLRQVHMKRRRALHHAGALRDVHPNCHFQQTCRLDLLCCSQTCHLWQSTLQLDQTLVIFRLYNMHLRLTPAAVHGVNAGQMLGAAATPQQKPRWHPLRGAHLWLVSASVQCLAVPSPVMLLLLPLPAVFLSRRSISTDD